MEITHAEQTTVAAAMPPAERAALALNSSQTERDLLALATKHAGIQAIKDKAGRKTGTRSTEKINIVQSPALKNFPRPSAAGSPSGHRSGGHDASRCFLRLVGLLDMRINRRRQRAGHARHIESPLSCL
jgi:hypothetical protein